MVLGADMYLVLSPVPCDTGERMGYQASESDSPVATPDPTISVGMALDVLWHDKKHATDMKKILLAIVSFGIFVAAMFLHIPTTNMYHQHYGVSSALATSGDDTVTDESPVKFYNIETIPDIFDWLNKTFIPQVFITTNYNDAVLPEDQWGRISTFNKVLGSIHFQLSYMQSGECDLPHFLDGLYSNCYDSSSTSTDELLISINTNASDATTLLTKKKDSSTWLDSSTQQMVITVITLNGQLPAYAVTKLQFDFNDGGYVEPSASTTSTLVDHYASATPIVVDTLVVLWFSPWILTLAIIQYVRSYEKKHHLATPSHWLKLAKHTAKAIGVSAFPDAFAAAGTVVFGDRVEDFSSFLSAMKSCVNMIYGDFDFDSIKTIDYSVVYYWSFMAMETFVLLNIVLAIVVDAYQEEKTKKDKNKCWVFFRGPTTSFASG
ncbi:hypothetical protein PR003_g98 [Phytophthora rubi]|uniref:Polycystin cation channel PKD1/PKD2 domain-containing protein n=1 Tax=Phytophthora rubi TaxID=129364 RepID=A0A6A4G9Q9_9STRA|nr:hypothetical protein PR003_g98 [Phytophthora rubi]